MAPAMASFLLRLHELRRQPLASRTPVYEEALQAFPGSYKIWKAYCDERVAAVRADRQGRPLSVPPTGDAEDPAVLALNVLYARALRTMHKFPVFWLDFLRLLFEQHRLTDIRTTVDDAVRALPITLHHRIWDAYVEYILGTPGYPLAAAMLAFRRALQVDPSRVEDFVAFLTRHRAFEEAAHHLAAALNDPSFSSAKGKTRHALWLELCELITAHPAALAQVNVDGILRGGIARYQAEVGRLWTALADYYIRRGLFERARDVYEEALAHVPTVRDFSLVFDALAQFEESVVSAKMEAAPDEEDADADAEASAILNEGADDPFLLRPVNDLDLRLARLEHLMARRPLLLSGVMLRQNPNNAHEWLKRVELLDGDRRRQAATFEEAVATVKRPAQLWIAYGKFHEAAGELEMARAVFGRACGEVEWKRAEDCASVWCERIELELRHDAYDAALDLSRRATEEPRRRRVVVGGEAPAADASSPARSQRVWDLRCDLEESVAATLDEVRAAYDDRLARKLATPQTVLNYALLLWEKDFFEEAFRVYERGVALFHWPNCVEIWRTYLAKFAERYGGRKLERLRDLYDQCLAGCPPDLAKPFYLDRAKLEEEHGLARREMEVLARAAGRVSRGERRAVVELYAERARVSFGIGKAREVYQRAVNRELGMDVDGAGLTDDDTLALCRRWAALEVSLGEVDRARAIYAHASQLADPSGATPGAASFWSAWSDMEVKHGDEATFREMLRCKRSVAAAGGFGAAATRAPPAAGVPQPGTTGAAAAGGFVAATTLPGTAGTAAAAAAAAGGGPVAENDEEIDLDLDLDDDEEGGGKAAAEVPDDVLAAAQSAKERFKRARVE